MLGLIPFLITSLDNILRIKDKNDETIDNTFINGEYLVLVINTNIYNSSLILSDGQNVIEAYFENERKMNQCIADINKIYNNIVTIAGLKGQVIQLERFFFNMTQRYTKRKLTPLSITSDTICLIIESFSIHALCDVHADKIPKNVNQEEKIKELMLDKNKNKKSMINIGLIEATLFRYISLYKKKMNNYFGKNNENGYACHAYEFNNKNKLSIQDCLIDDDQQNILEEYNESKKEKGYVRENTLGKKDTSNETEMDEKSQDRDNVIEIENNDSDERYNESQIVFGHSSNSYATQNFDKICSTGFVESEIQESNDNVYKCVSQNGKIYTDTDFMNNKDTTQKMSNDSQTDIYIKDLNFNKSIEKRNLEGPICGTDSLITIEDINDERSSLDNSQSPELDLSICNEIDLNQLKHKLLPIDTDPLKYNVTPLGAKKASISTIESSETETILCHSPDTNCGEKRKIDSIESDKSQFYVTFMPFKNNPFCDCISLVTDSSDIHDDENEWTPNKKDEEVNLRTKNIRYLKDLESENCDSDASFDSPVKSPSMEDLDTTSIAMWDEII